MINNIPKIIISHKVNRKMKAFADLCPEEISALGTVQVFNNTIYVNDLFLFHQVVTPSTTELSNEDMARFIFECDQKGIDPSTIKFWWHSHVNMNTFWSSTDTDTINKYSKSWMISLVSNKQGDTKLRLDFFSPFRMHIDDVPYTIEYDKAYNPIIQREIDEKVHKYVDTNVIRRLFFEPGAGNTNYPTLGSEPIVMKEPMIETPNLPDGEIKKSPPLQRYVKTVSIKDKISRILFGERPA